MIPSISSSQDKLLQYLRKVAPYSIIERGILLASNDSVAECSRSGSVIQGVVRDEEGATQSSSLTIVSSHSVEARCSCSNAQDMDEQWCLHAVALFWRAGDLDFFSPRSGFSDRESTFRMNSCAPSEIAVVMRDLARHGDVSHVSIPTDRAPLYTPEVTIVLDLATDRLGIKVLFDAREQAPVIFEGYHRSSSRALDNILLKLLDEVGSWDDTGSLWFVNSSEQIEMVMGLIQEYQNVRSLPDLKPIRFSAAAADAELVLTWSEGSLDMGMNWLVPDDGRLRRVTRTRSGETFGTGPYWTTVEGIVYRLASKAARIASIFGNSPSITVPRSQVAPILEALGEPEGGTSIQVLHSELQPAIETFDPTPTLSLERRDVMGEHFTSARQIELSATLSFEYPAPPQGKNVVFLPNRAKEDEFTQDLLSMGFLQQSERRKFAVTGDLALDFLHSEYQRLGKPWKLTGIEALRKGVRFADLNITVSIQGTDEAASEGGKKKPKKTTLSGIDWFDCHVALVQNNSNVPISAVFKNARADSDKWTRLDSGAYARVPGGTIATLKSILGTVEANARLSNTIRSRLSLAQAISLSRINDVGFSVNIDKRLTALNEKLSNFSEIKILKASKGFVGKLRRYQEEGLSWLNFLHEHELGGILADEMGLGKTVQTLAFFQALKELGKLGGGPILIIAPTSVITNWQYEVKKFTPNMSVLMLHGPTRRARFNEIPESDIVLTSYALLRLDRYDLERHEFSYVVLDEAQNVKNPQAATTKAAKALSCRHRLALTGTPTENRPMELWSIIDFLLPGYLGSYDFFRNTIERPILEGGPNVEIAQLLSKKTKPFIMRRLKAQVEKELPPKIESVVHVDMTSSQRQLYSEILEEVRPKVFEAVKQKGIQGASVSILAALLRLRQVCNHPNSIEAFSDTPGFDSGKFELLKDLTEEALESGRKILLFSQFRGMLAIIRSWLEQSGVNHLYLDGTTRNRQDLIDRFSTDDSVRLFLISLKAGGTGLNLMAADTVIIYDPWWNPAVESQAVDRAHRIGQSKTVTVYRLVTTDSVEQKIMALKEKKSKIVDALINENGLSTVKLSKVDLESLFSPLAP